MANEKRICPYLFQAGIDFGCAYAKIIIRDLNTNKAWAYHWKNAAEELQFLIPATLICDAGELHPHRDVSVSYPHNGLWHLKRALEMAALHEELPMADPLMLEYGKLLGNNFYTCPKSYIFMICAFYLAVIINDIHGHIRKKINDFGQNSADHILVNLGIPPARFGSHKEIYANVLKLGYLLSSNPAFQGDSMPLEKLASLLGIPPTSQERDILEIICHVYPETTANAFALSRALNNLEAYESIYFISDVGAGSTKQCVCSFSEFGQNSQFKFFLEAERAPGSSDVERRIFSLRPFGVALEFWNKEKEGIDAFTAIKSRVFHQALPPIHVAVADCAKKLLRSLLEKCPSNDENGQTLWLKKNIKFIFIGGGHCEVPFQDAILSAFTSFTPGQRDICFSSMPYPPDLTDMVGTPAPMSRLTTAYGLSFPFMDIAKFCQQ